MSALARSTVLCALSCLFAGSAWTQEFRATVTGRVTDPAGLAMPGVTVSVLNTRTNEVASAPTTADGVYSLPFLKPGLYTLTAELQGFESTRGTGCSSRLGKPSRSTSGWKSERSPRPSR